MLHTLTNLPRRYKQIMAMAMDFICLPLLLAVAIWLRYEGLNPDLLRHYFWLFIAAPCISVPVFARIGLYRAVVRFIDQKIIGVIVLGATTSVLALTFISLMLHILPISRAVFGFFWMGSIFYLSASRFAARHWLARVSLHEDAIPVCIYGAGQAGAQLAAMMRHDSQYVCVAFVDDNPQKHGALIGGVRVYDARELSRLITKFEIRELLLAMPSISRARHKQILDQLEPCKLKIRLTPSLKTLMSGELKMQDIREVDVEDLLGRDTVEPDQRLLGQCIKGQYVAVTGAGGSIGSELCRQILRQQPLRLILIESSEYALYAIEQELAQLAKQYAPDCELLPILCSVRQQDKLEALFSAFSITTVYHAAAYKHVPLVEHNPAEGVLNNVFGTLSVAQAAMATGVKNFVLISTDKAVRPTNVMGTTKRIAELILQAFAREQQGTRFCMVRFGNVLGSSGSVVPLFKKQILAGGPVTLTHPDITRYFMTIPEAAQLVIQAGAMGEGGDVFVLNMGDPVRIHDLARRMIHLFGLEVRSDKHPDGDIEIRHVGLRPGEKLYEELLIGDNVEGTTHPLIMRAQETELPWEQLQHLLNRLHTACEQNQAQEIRMLLLQMVAEYQPQCEIEDFLWKQKQLS